MPATARLDLRLSDADRERITQAASLSGLALATFVRLAVLKEADRLMAAESFVVLSAKESKRFMEALRKPFTPNAALRKAMARGDKLGI